MFGSTRHVRVDAAGDWSRRMRRGEVLEVVARD